MEILSVEILHAREASIMTSRKLLIINPNGSTAMTELIKPGIDSNTGQGVCMMFEDPSDKSLTCPRCLTHIGHAWADRWSCKTKRISTGVRRHAFIYCPALLRTTTPSCLHVMRITHWSHNYKAGSVANQ